jgi:uncharacterized membrane protein YfhO
MPDIKSEIVAEKPLALNEKPLVNKENLKYKPEAATEKEKASHFERIKEDVANKIDLAEKATAPAVTPPASIMAPMAKQQKQIENILAKDLEEIYINLSPEKKEEFKKTGEQTANKINQLLTQTKINVGEIIRLIKKWLSLIPGINKYFLEQEAKIKADELIKLRK